MEKLNKKEQKAFVALSYDDDESVWKKGYFAEVCDVPDGFVFAAVTLYVVRGVLRQKCSPRSREVILGLVYNVKDHR